MNLKKSTIEPSESVDFTNKKTLPKKCFNNGGVDVARFELFKKFYEHLNDNYQTKSQTKIIATLSVY